MTPLVSVIIPCYQQARFVAAAVTSVLSQSYPQVEVIVVDDGSTDNPQTALANYSDSIQFVRQENRGLAAARNAGFHLARGEFLLFLDSDDQLLPDALERHVALLEAHPDYALTYSAWQQVSEDGREVYGVIRPNVSGHVLEPLLLRRFFFFASSALVRRTCLEQVGLFDEAILWGEDADLWTRLAYAGFAFGYLDEPLTRYRIHAKSMTAQVSLEQSASWTGLLDKFFSIPDLPEHLKMLKGEAYAVLHYETAGRCYRAGQIELAEHHLKAALEVFPQVQPEWLLEWVAGTALDSRTSRPDEFMHWVNDTLKDQGLDLGRRVQGRYHTAAVFAAYQSRHMHRIRPHIIPALLSDPSMLLNRGFLRIAFEVVLRKQL